MVKRVAVVLVSVGFLFANLSCNLFGAFGPSDDYDKMLDRYGPQALILEGKNRMAEGKWEEAYELFDMATKASPANLSEAWFYKGKCILRMNSVDLKQVWGEINPNKEDTNAVPFLYRAPEGRTFTEILTPPYTMTIHKIEDTATILVDSVFLERKRVYDAIAQAVKCLEVIHYDRYGLMDGVIRREQYESDYLIEISVKTVLGIIDHNNNDTLDYHGDERDIFKIMCSDIPSLDSMDFDSLKTISRDPKEINQKLDLILATVNKADTSYLNFNAELIEGAKKSDDISPKMAQGVGNMIGNFKDILPYYYYNDRKNNDELYDTLIGGNRVRLPRMYNTDTIKEGEWRALNGYPPGSAAARVDRMIWIDWDFDDLIDVDQTNRYHIGSYEHRAAFPQYYTPIDSLGGDYRRYVYIGPHTYEFIAGDWGVDEEIMDGEDNDQDELTDEDTRIVADTLDDDEDYVEMTAGSTYDINILTPEGQKLWLWGAGPYRYHYNVPFKASDVGTVLTDAHGTKFTVTSFIDSGEVRALIDPALNGAYDETVMPDSLGKTITIRSEWAGHSVYDPVVWVDVNGNGLIDGVDGSAPAYNNEFVAGDWGIDEEWFDGMDNDQDGAVDEDIGERLPPSSLRAYIIQNQVR